MRGPAPQGNLGTVRYHNSKLMCLVTSSVHTSWGVREAGADRVELK